MARIGFVFLEILSCEGGIQTYVRDLLAALPIAMSLGQSPGLSADVFLLRDGSEVENPFASSVMRFQYFKSSHPNLGRAKLAAALVTYILRSQPQHIYCGHINLAPMVSAICNLFKIPFTILTYGKEVWEPLSSSKIKALQSASRIWTISRYSRDRLCASNAIDPNQVDFMYCAVDGNVFKPAEKDAGLVEKYNLQNSRVLMTVARLWSGDRYKGVDVTIRALPEIARSFPDVKYLVLGRGDDQPRLAKLAEDFGMGDRVVFAGFVPNDALIAHYNLADAYVMPSQEGFGIVYLEAMACGVPVLSGDADGSSDPLQDGKLGWQVPHRDPDAVAMAVCEMLKGDVEKTDGAWLRSQCLEIFDKPAIAARLAQLI
jgi:phosphatidyl-myo-inositol dimannoside synthase